MKKLFLIDAYALIYRFHYAFVTNPMRNPEGRNVSAVFGFVKFLYELIDRENPEYLGVAFDPKGGNFRHKIYEHYKANRDATPEDIIYATPIIKEILEAMHIPILEVADYEADDVIGTLSSKACCSGEFMTYMVTPDKDYAQLVTNCSVMYKPSKGGSGIEVWGVEEVCKSFGIERTEQVVDILAIWGDASDNIPGVAGIGQKGATKLVVEFGSVEGVIANIDKITGKTKEKIETSMDNLRMSKVLATICTDAPIDFSPDELRICEPNAPTLRELYRTHNFRYFLQRLDSEALHIAASSERSGIQAQSYSEQKQAEATQGSLFDEQSNSTPVHFSSPTTGQYVDPKSDYLTIANRPHTYKLIDSEDELRSLMTELSQSKRIAFDTETTSLNAMQAELLGVSFSVASGEAYWVPISTPNSIEIIRPVLESNEIEKVGQNIKYDIEVLARYEITVQGRLYDTMLMHYLLDAEGRHSLDAMSRNFLGYSPISIEELIGKGSKQLSMSQVPAELLKDYAAEDADITLTLFEHFLPMMEQKSIVELYSKIEEPLISVLCGVERNGVRVDTAQLQGAREKLSGRLAEIEDEIYTTSGSRAINLGSPKQLGELLFDTLRLNDKAKKTKTGQYKTDEATLESLRDSHPIVGQILEWRGIKKLLSTYIDALPELIDTRTGRIHTSFNQAATATGRLSSSNPNLQNIPIRDAMGRDIRRAFVPQCDGWKIVAADYSQIELRIMAHLSEDSALIEAFVMDEDIHTATAAKIYGVPISEVTSEQRRRAKTANFGIIYGISTYGLASRLAISNGEAKELIDGYFALYGGVKDYMDRVVEEATTRGYVETIFGRRRYLADITSSNKTMRGFAQRNAVNAPIQGSAADIMKLAMIRVDSEIRRRELKAMVILQVHDELVIETPDEEIDTIKEILQEAMSGAIELKVPLTIDIGVGNSWLEAH